MSFNPQMVAALARIAPAIPRGLTTDAFAPRAWPQVPAPRLAELRRIDTAAADACFVSHDHRDLVAPRLVALRGAGVPILTWTIRSPAAEQAVRRLADAITFEGYLPAPSTAG
jgi:hypothetical protein